MNAATRVDALIVGAGPAGLMAAEVLAGQGARVLVAEAMPTPARKFLMAGKSGLNLTKNEGRDAFSRRLHGPMLQGVGQVAGHALGIDEFGPAEAIRWAKGLGIEMFTGSTGRVFPVGMKASPLLRAWLSRLRGQGVDLRTRWRWTGFEGQAWRFDTPDGAVLLDPNVAVLGLGGASWPRLGSDATWIPWLAGQGVRIAPFRPANMGFRVHWSAAMTRHFGQAVKGTAISAGALVSRGEWVVTAQGVEGGGIYEIAQALRDGQDGRIDLAPDLPLAELARRFYRAPARLSVGNRIRRVLGDPMRAALLMEWGQPLPADPDGLAAAAKSLPLRHDGAAGLDRAISSAGGIMAEALGERLELSVLPGVFAAGEMLDWEAPTGGYLLTACLASGRLAGTGAAMKLGLRPR
ncbi:TIGR03862 family flavoprotein [Paracoccus sp. CPCC 101403]|uniref:TIGR03862 family flavoprotein n=2 Tax=Paracoccus broussonetiae TaxID=3075834 RepID=A0ABU3EF09_9RHOB|nr:TIGR03862 family flavoprotein [Paracoccus sp. CPCC 101403]MDT1062789.1 TIGR03862 family flavoprotein [Paracoccus sp. CPCC 101403]